MLLFGGGRHTDTGHSDRSHRRRRRPSAIKCFHKGASQPHFNTSTVKPRPYSTIQPRTAMYPRLQRMQRAEDDEKQALKDQDVLIGTGLSPWRRSS